MQEVARPFTLPHTRRWSADDVEAIATEGGGWEGGFLQLGRGRLEYRRLRIVLPGLYVDWHAVDQHVLGRWHYQGSGLTIAHVRGIDGPLRYRGRDLRSGEALLLHAGREHEYVTPRRTRGYEIVVAPDVVASRGWQIAPVPLPRAAPARRRALDDASRAVTREVTRRKGQGWTPGQALALRDRLLDALECAYPRYLGVAEAGSSRSSPPLTRAHDRVRRALEFAQAAGPRGPVNVAVLADGIEVSERTLYQAFRDVFGVGPYEFQQIQRLHAFRAALGNGTLVHGKIARAAARVGLHDASRMTQAYRRLFGETPRQSLRRWSVDGPPPFPASDSNPAGPSRQRRPGAPSPR